MSIITTYPGIVSVSGDDLLVIADMSVLGTPTRTVRVDQLIGTGGGGGTVLSVDGGNSSFINIAGGPITVSGTLTASLSATGTPSSSTYLRGDNTWATIPGGNVGTVTNVSYSTNITAFTAAVANATSTPSLTLNLNGGSVGQFLRQDGTWATVPTGSGTVESVGLSTNIAAFQVVNSPITGIGTLEINLNGGSTGQFLRQDGTWATIPGGNPGTVTEVGVSSNYLTIGNTPITSNGTISVNVPVSGVTAGAYTNANITVDQYGFVTAAANGSGGGSTSPAGSDTQVQYNNSGAFGAGAFFTTNKTSKVDVKYELGLVGDGTNQGLLKLYCEAGTPHYVGIKGPNHSGGNSYTLQLPNTLPAVANQILESNASGTLSWIATPSGGSGTVTSVTGQDGIVMTGTATDPVVNVDYLGTDNYILTALATNPADSSTRPSREADMNFSTERTSKQVYYTTLADIVDTGNGYKMTAFRLDVASGGATPTITMISNHIGGTWSISRIGVGEYNITNSNGAIFTDKTICYINNPNIAGTVGATTNVFPQATNIRRKAATLISVECFEVGTTTGNRGDSADLGTANPIYVEIKIYD